MYIVHFCSIAFTYRGDCIPDISAADDWNNSPNVQRIMLSVAFTNICGDETDDWNSSLLLSRCLCGLLNLSEIMYYVDISLADDQNNSVLLCNCVRGLLRSNRIVYEACIDSC